MKIVDIHMHALPEIDDGSRSWSETTEMIKRSVQQGISAIVLTPHSWGIDQIGIDNAQIQFDTAKTFVKMLKIPVDLYLGCEMLVSQDTVDDCILKIHNGQYPTLAGSRCVLTEFEKWFSQNEMEYCVKKITAAGYVPVIAHAERYDKTSAAGVEELKKLGAMVQINAYSIVNEQKASTRETANALLVGKLVDFIGSDAHRLDHRPPVIADGIAMLTKMYSEEYARKLLLSNPKELLNI